MLRTALQGCEKLIRAALELDPAATARLNALSGQRIALVCTGPPLQVLAVPDGVGGITLSPLDEDALTREAPDLVLRGPAQGFVRQFFSDEPGTDLSASALRLDGNAELAQILGGILADLELDWQAALAPLFGDLLSRELSWALSDGLGSLRSGATRVLESLGEQVVGAWRWAPSADELETFYANLRDLRQDVDRVEARIRRLREPEQ